VCAWVTAAEVQGGVAKVGGAGGAGAVGGMIDSSERGGWWGLLGCVWCGLL